MKRKRSWLTIAILGLSVILFPIECLIFVSFVLSGKPVPLMNYLALLGTGVCTLLLVRYLQLSK